MHIGGLGTAARLALQRLAQTTQHLAARRAQLHGRLQAAIPGFQLNGHAVQVLLKTSTVKHSSSTVQHTLQTLRYKLFAKAGYITTESRKPILNLALAMQQRTWLQGLWDASKPSICPPLLRPSMPVDEVIMENLG